MDTNRKIIESTIKNVNRVLHAWSLEDKRTIKEDELSLFRTYFYRSIKENLGWRNSKHYMKRYEYIPIISNRKLIGISFENNYNFTVDNNIKSLNEEIIVYNFKNYNNLNPVKELEPIDIVPNEYENILNIKF